MNSASASGTPILQLEGFRKLVTGILCGKAIPQSPRGWREIELQFTADLSWSARATRASNGRYSVVMDVGTAVTTALVLIQLLAHRAVMPSFSSSWFRRWKARKGPAKFPLASLHAVCLDSAEFEGLISADSCISLHRFIDRLPADLNEELAATIAALGHDRQRSLITAKLIECALLHMFAHEFSHIYRGHLDYVIESGLLERLQESDSRYTKDGTDYWAIEHMADMSASWISSSFMMVTAASWGPLFTKMAMLQLLRLWSFAVAVCYLIDDQIREGESLYPPPIDRADAAIRIVKVTMADKLGIPQGRLSTALGRGVRDALEAWDLAGWSRRPRNPTYYDNKDLYDSIRKIEMVLTPPPNMWPDGLGQQQWP
ncbi:hypothetical protein ATY77_20925 [Rhizobium sp. R634]|uniref:hypothetical protein n=1 Tax=Rhizobium sp. R634 TaxID=1764274 RepID=UPI000B52EA97|nr:hypothetical protein [Rhizobium sp. R634]OWV69632.1 hypothetical protein ATY77_20925 [Rhizobium sp. R634]